MENSKINYSIKDTSQTNTDISYDDLLNDVNSHEKVVNKIEYNDDFSNEYTVLSIHYKENFLKKELERIAEYYEISLKNNRRKKKKEDLVNDIVLFEINVENTYIVERRKELWLYIEEIKSDSYLNKFLLLD
tara:strand:- start:475 stop:870 length:396 start_codon:yes stop_codon:yes gene_type:complete